MHAERPCPPIEVVDVRRGAPAQGPRRAAARPGAAGSTAPATARTLATTAALTGALTGALACAPALHSWRPPAPDVPDAPARTAEVRHPWGLAVGALLDARPAPWHRDDERGAAGARDAVDDAIAEAADEGGAGAERDGAEAGATAASSAADARLAGFARFNPPAAYLGEEAPAVVLAQSLAAHLAAARLFETVGLADAALDDDWTRGAGLQLAPEAPLILRGTLRAAHAFLPPAAGATDPGRRPPSQLATAWWLSVAARVSPRHPLAFALTAGYDPAVGALPDGAPAPWGGVAILSPVLLEDRETGAIVWAGEAVGVVAPSGEGAGQSGEDAVQLTARAIDAAFADLASRLAAARLDVVNARAAARLGGATLDGGVRAGSVDPEAVVAQARAQAAYGDAAAGVRLADAALVTWPGRAPELRAARAVARWRLQDVLGAADDVAATGAWVERDPELWFVLGRIEAQTGRPAEAARWHERACAAGHAAACPPASAPASAY